MALPVTSDQPLAGATLAPDDTRGQQGAPATDGATTDTPSSWWSAPAGKPIGIPDFAHELHALAEWLLPAPRAIPLRVRAQALRR